MHVNQIRFMLYHERERKNKENANFVLFVYLLAKLCDIFDEAFLIDVSIHVYACNIEHYFVPPASDKYRSHTNLYI